MTVIVVTWLVTISLAVYVRLRHGTPPLVRAGEHAYKTIVNILPTMAMALLVAGFAGEVLPAEFITSFISNDSGFTGILLASAIGGILPGGPIASFPIALVVWHAGAGVPQMVALIVGWSVFAIHRVLIYEMPMMGWQFSVLRLAASFVLPPLAGLAAMAALAVFGDAALHLFGPIG